MTTLFDDVYQTIPTEWKSKPEVFRWAVVVSRMAIRVGGGATDTIAELEDALDALVLSVPESARDAVGAALTDSSTIDFSFNDPANTITASVIDNTSTQKIEIHKAAVAAGTRKRINFIDGTNIAITATDNPGDDRVDVTIDAGGGSSSMTEVEVDFGSTPRQSLNVVVVDAGVTGASKILVGQSGAAPTGKAADENEMDAFAVSATPSAGSFILRLNSIYGAVIGNYKFNYMVA